MSDSPDVGPIIGEVQEADGRGVVRVQDRFDIGIQDLWSAVTDPTRITGWLGGVEGDLRVGGRFDAFFLASGWEGEGTVQECEEPSHLVVSTRESDGTQGTTIEVSLRAEDKRTGLVVEERGMALGHVAAYGAGMQMQVENLATYLRGEELGDSRARWVELVPAYQEQAEQLGLSSP